MWRAPSLFLHEVCLVGIVVNVNASDAQRAVTNKVIENFILSSID